MTTFAYTAREPGGQSVSGTITAASLAEALQRVRSEGRYPVALRPVNGAQRGPAGVDGRRGIHIPRAEVIQLVTQLAIMMETGVNLNDALDCIERQADKPTLKALLRDVHGQVQAGSSLSEALARHPRSFPRVLVALMRASEKSGMMARLLNRAVAYLRDEQEVRRKVKGAMVYPFIMFAFATIATVFLLTFVLPRFTVIYEAKKAALPVPTRVLMDISSFLVSHWRPLLGGVVAAAVSLAMVIRTAAGARAWNTLQLGLPLFGGILRKLHLARGLRTAGTMAASGVSLLECVEAAHDLSGNVHFRKLWQQAGEQIQAGRQLSEALMQNPLVPRGVAHMIHSGEKSGRLGPVMEQVATYAEQELKEQISALTRYIEPLMIVIMGVIIGGICLALLLPIFTISRVMAH